MVVIAIVGVLSAIGIGLFRKHVTSGHAIEAANTIQAIRAAQERWRAETQRYFDVSTSLKSFYPRATPDRDLYPWQGKSAGHADVANWRRLNVPSLGQVRCVYATVAGNVGTSPDSEALDGFTGPVPTFGNPTQPWYLIRASCDLDGDGDDSRYLATSLNGEIYVENEGE